MKKIFLLLLLFIGNLYVSLVICAQDSNPGRHPYASDKPMPVPVVFKIPGVTLAWHITFAPDGKTFYFLTDYNGMEVIKYCRFEKGNWSAPKTASFSGKYRQECPCLSPDGSKLFFGTYNETTGELWVMEKKGKGWSQPKNLGYPINIQGSFQGFASVAANGNLYFTSNRDGGAKIYCAKWVGGQYLAPEKLAGTINANEVSGPFIAPDESFIVFAVLTMGEYKLAISFNKNNVWTSPKIMGREVNSGGRPCISPDGNYLFFNREEQIYQVDWQPLLESLRKANSAPYLKTPLPDQTFAPGERFSFQLDRNCFMDDDEGDVLMYKVKLANGKELPSWVTFDPETLTFTGMNSEAKTMGIKVTATDKAGASAVCSFRLIIRSL